jgi:hypothetical protein
MHTFFRTALTVLLATCALNAQASLKQLGADFRTMMSNYTMVSDIKKRCPQVALPELTKRYVVEKAMQNKIGIQNYIQLMMQLNKSDDNKNALATIDKLWGQIEGCQDPQLDAALGRIADVHRQAYRRFDAEPALVKPKAVPVPLQRR